MKIVLEIMYFLAPAAFATIAPQLAAHFKVLEKWNKPIDFYRNYRGKRVFGDHKTIRGYILGIIVGLATGFIQYLLSGINFFDRHSLVDYGNLFTALVLGSLMGFGALFGDSIKSFFKRQLNIAPGRSWFFFDQVDFIIGGFVLALPVVVLSLKYYILMIVIYFVLHVLTTSIGYLLGVKESWI